MLAMFERFTLNITKDSALACSHPGDCEADVRSEMDLPRYRHQLAKLDPNTLRAELKEYGAWEPEDLLDHETNLRRIFWIACCDIRESL